MKEKRETAQRHIEPRKERKIAVEVAKSDKQTNCEYKQKK